MVLFKLLDVGLEVNEEKLHSAVVHQFNVEKTNLVGTSLALSTDILRNKAVGYYEDSFFQFSK